MHKEQRVCFLDTERAKVQRIEPDSIPVPVDCELMISLLDEAPGNMLHELRRWSGSSGREICFIPLVTTDARRLMAQEADAREYGIGSVTDRPLTARKVSAFRVLRSERATIQVENLPKPDKGGFKLSGRHPMSKKAQQHG
jgi:hypothetical protein